jgi:hypothetical protein
MTGMWKGVWWQGDVQCRQACAHMHMHSGVQWQRECDRHMRMCMHIHCGRERIGLGVLTRLLPPSI